MSSIRLHLPLHAKSRQLLEVIGKCVGVESQQQRLGPDRGQQVDFSSPASASNSWIVRFMPAKSDFKVQQADHVNDLSFAYVIFSDLAGSAHRWELSSEHEDEDSRLLHPDSTALSVAVARRLLRFFGGSLQYNSSLVSECDEKRAPRTALYPPNPRAASARLSSDERFDAFQNALHQFPALSPQEIRDAAAHSSYGITPACQRLLDRLEVEASHQQISNATPTPAPSSRPRRM